MESTRIPPLGWFTLAAGGQWLLPGRPTAARAAAASPLVLASGWLIAGSLQEFRRRRTSVNPLRPERPTALVCGGPSAVTRHPMYAGMAGLLLAHAVLRGSALGLLPAAAYVLVMETGQIPREEAALAATFGTEFDAYRAEVPRWVDSRCLNTLARMVTRATHDERR